MVVLFPEGFAKVKKHIANLTPEDTLFIHADLPTVETQARKIILNFKDTDKFSRKREYWAMMALARALQDTNLYPLDAFKDALESRPQFAKENLAAVDAGLL